MTRTFDRIDSVSTIPTLRRLFIPLGPPTPNPNSFNSSNSFPSLSALADAAPPTMKKSQDIASRKCKRCSRVFSKAEHLKRHERSHTGERPHRCRFCGRAYARSDVLTRHVRDHHSALLETAAESPSDCQLDAPSTHSHGGSTSPPENQSFQVRILENLDSHVPESYASLLGLSKPTDVPEPNFQSPVLEDTSHSHHMIDTCEGLIGSSLNFTGLSESFNFPQDALDPMLLDGLLMTPPSSGDSSSTQSPKTGITDEQFEQVRRIWPTRRRKSDTVNSRYICWDDVILHPKDNLFSCASLESYPVLDSPDDLGSVWGFNQSCRDRLVHDCLHYYGGHVVNSHTHSPSQQGLAGGDVFPATDILDLCLDLYFYQFQTLLPFINPSTFDASQTPSILLFPICLVGLMILNRTAARTLITRYLPSAIEHCRAQLASRRVRQCTAPDLFVVLASACLLLFLAASTADIAFDEQRHEFYEETLILARDRGLFHPHRYDCSLVQAVNEESVSWKAWCRVQSAERLIATLILSDAYSAHMLGVAPVLSPHKIQMPALCSDELFSIRTLEKWRTGLGDQNPWERPHTKLHDSDNQRTSLGSFGIHTVLSCTWLKILKTNHRLLNSSPLSQHPLILAKDSEAQMLSSELCLIYTAYHTEFLSGNTNTVVLWHLLCICITTHLPTIEAAAGRNGSETAQEAMSSLSTWANTPHARRACLHAAQIFVVLGQQKRSDGVMLHSEMALFNAGLVLGFYLLTAPDQGSWDTSPGVDLLEEIDWTQVGDEGLLSSSASIQEAGDSTARFIRHGGPVTFRGAKYRNAYGTARRSFMNFAARLDEIGRWNVDEYCRVLQIISDTLVIGPGKERRQVL